MILVSFQGGTEKPHMDWTLCCTKAGIRTDEWRAAKMEMEEFCEGQQEKKDSSRWLPLLLRCQSAGQSIPS